MSRYLLDTNHASAFWRQPTRVTHRLSAPGGAEIGLCLPSLGELWFMVFNSARVVANEAELNVFVRAYRLWDLNPAAATEFGRIKAELRKAGRPIPDVDAQIAAIARSNGLVLLTADAHFQFVASLKTENWLAPLPPP